ncbi:unnamed protein product [Thlaspi arvense]|uniref:peptidylprolyl isomerase n=1 Tax=Thlaspi arvense TaxID=13288 RepID=A0AAU9RVG2_THLAR|nr:unnamed protein product [Thlaspi arvense]
MAFWGVELKPGKPFTLKSTEIKRLHLSQATLGLGNATTRSILQCNVGNKSPLFLCVLSPEKVDSCQLNIEFEEADDVVFSVIGPRSIHLTGYFLGKGSGLGQNDDESESYGEDIVDTDLEKGSSDDYDYSDSFINDNDPSALGSHVSSTDEDESMPFRSFGGESILVDFTVSLSGTVPPFENNLVSFPVSIKEMAAKTKDKETYRKGGRLRKKFQVSDSDSDETSARADDSTNEDSIEVENKIHAENPLPSRLTRSKARSSIFENGEPNSKCEKTSEAKTQTDNTLDKSEDKLLVVAEPSPVKNECETLPKKKQNKEKSKTSVVINLDEGDERHMPESLQNEKQASEKGIESSIDALPSQNGDDTTKKKRKRDRREEATKSKKQAIDHEKNVEKEAVSNEVIIEEIEQGKPDGKTAVNGKKVSILYTSKLKDTGEMVNSNIGETPFRFRLGGEKVIKGLSVGVEGMRVGDKRRLIIPPSLGYSEEGLNGDVPKNAWLVYEVEVVKVR